MVLFVAIFKDYRKVEDLMLGFLEQGVTGATIIEGRGMGQIIGEIPNFAGSRGLFPGSASDSQVVVAAMDAPLAKACVALAGRIVDLDQPGTGIIFTVPLGETRGLDARFD